MVDFKIVKPSLQVEPTLVDPFLASVLTPTPQTAVDTLAQAATLKNEAIEQRIKIAEEAALSTTEGLGRISRGRQLQEKASARGRGLARLATLDSDFSFFGGGASRLSREGQAEEQRGQEQLLRAQQTKESRVELSNLRQTRALNQLDAKLAIKEQRKGEFLAGLNLDELNSLEEAADKASDGSVDVGDGVQLNFQEIRERRLATEEQDLSLRSQQLAVAAQDLQLANAHGAKLLRTLTVSQIDAALENNGLVILPSGNQIRMAPEDLEIQRGIAEQVEAARLLRNAGKHGPMVNRLNHEADDVNDQFVKTLDAVNVVFAGRVPSEVVSQLNSLEESNRELTNLGLALAEDDSALDNKVAQNQIATAMAELKKQRVQIVDEIATQVAGKDEALKGVTVAFLNGTAANPNDLVDSFTNIVQGEISDREFASNEITQVALETGRKAFKKGAEELLNAQGAITATGSKLRAQAESGGKLSKTANIALFGVTGQKISEDVKALLMRDAIAASTAAVGDIAFDSIFNGKSDGSNVSPTLQGHPFFVDRKLNANIFAEAKEIAAQKIKQDGVQDADTAATIFHSELARILLVNGQFENFMDLVVNPTFLQSVKQGNLTKGFSTVLDFQIDEQFGIRSSSQVLNGLQEVINFGAAFKVDEQKKVTQKFTTFANNGSERLFTALSSMDDSVVSDQEANQLVAAVERKILSAGAASTLSSFAGAVPREFTNSEIESTFFNTTLEDQKLEALRQRVLKAGFKDALASQDRAMRIRSTRFNTTGAQQ